jgi:hypothetical protein
MALWGICARGGCAAMNKFTISIRSYADGDLILSLRLGQFTFYYSTGGSLITEEGEAIVQLEDLRPGCGGLTLGYSEGRYICRIDRTEAVKTVKPHE